MQDPMQRDRELYSPDVDWLLNRSCAELGFKGTLGSMISILEHGGMPTGVPSTDLDDYRMGWCAGEDPAEKWRRIAPVWFLLSDRAKLVLSAHYSHRNDLPENTRVAVEGALGKLGSASLVVHDGDALAKLITACVDKGKGGRNETIKAATKRTDEAVRGCHLEWALWRDMLGDEPWEKYIEIRMEERLKQSAPKKETKADRAKWNAEYDRRQREKLCSTGMGVTDSWITEKDEPVPVDVAMAEAGAIECI